MANGVPSTLYGVPVEETIMEAFFGSDYRSYREPSGAGYKKQWYCMSMKTKMYVMYIIGLVSLLLGVYGFCKGLTSYE